VLLAVGAATGIALAAAGVLRSSNEAGPLTRGTIARVNDRLISQERYSRSLEMLASDKRNELTHADRVHVLSRLIEEELLIQRGVEIGLVASDPSVRKSIAAAMIQSIIADAASVPPSRDELEEFYAQNVSFFTGPGRFRVQQIVFRGQDGENEDAFSRARQAGEALEKGTPFKVVQERFGDQTLTAVPDVLLPPHKLREYLGPTLARTAMTLDAGGMDKALRDYLDRLVDEADLAFAESAPR
jgi:hypothetical protein